MKFSLKTILVYFIALVWFLNGVYCKLLNFVPRHQLIVGRILGSDHAMVFTRLIGTAELLICIWVVSRRKSRLCAWVQAVIILSMNTIEFIKVPDLLLFGRGNAILALLLICLILWNEYFVGQKLRTPLKKAHV